VYLSVSVLMFYEHKHRLSLFLQLKFIFLKNDVYDVCMFVCVCAFACDLCIASWCTGVIFAQFIVDCFSATL